MTAQAKYRITLAVGFTLLGISSWISHTAGGDAHAYRVAINIGWVALIAIILAGLVRRKQTHG